MAYHRQQKHKTNYHDKPFERKHKKNYTPREEFRGYYAKVREGEDCMKAYRKIKKIKEYSFEKEWFVSELLISLGMIGTVIGFIFMLYSVFVDLNIEDAQAVQESLGGMAQGMGTALLTTLVGLIGSVLIKSQLVMVENGEV